MCTPCAAGTYNPAARALAGAAFGAAQACLPATVCAAGSQFTAAPASATADAVCARCPSGSTTTVGSADTCHCFPAGYTLASPTGFGATLQCCPANSAWSGVGAAGVCACLPGFSPTATGSPSATGSTLSCAATCAVNTFLGADGNCAPCPAGSSTNGLTGQASCACPANSYGTGAGAQLVCRSCGPDATSAAGSSSCTCKAPNAAPWTAAAGCYCAAGFRQSYTGIWPGNPGPVAPLACSACPAGTFSDLAMAAPNPFADVCSPAPQGSYTPIAASPATIGCGAGATSGLGSSACRCTDPNALWEPNACACGPGYGPVGSTVCTTCLPGFAQSGAAATGNFTCTACPADTFNALGSGGACLPCPLAAAGGVIAHNGNRLGKSLWTEVDQGEKVKVIGVWDGPEEARTVSDAIESRQRRGGRASDCAILVRAQFQTREFEDRFIAIGMPYRIVGGFRFYERAEIRDALAYLRIIYQPSDDLAFERIVNTPKRGLGDKAVQKVHMLSRARQAPLLHAAALILDSDELTPQARRALGNLVGDIARWRDLAGQISHAELARVVLDESGYTTMLQADRSPESAGRLENLNELARAMEDYETLGAFLEHVSLVMDNDATEDADKVTIMTIHGAKGLEFVQTFLVGWEEGVFPSQRALDEGGLASLEEERRLAYVAITRARAHCTILHAANRRIYGQWTSSIPSRFIAELPPEHIEQDSTLQPVNAWQPSARNEPRTLVQARPALKPVEWSQPARADIMCGQRVFHTKFGYGSVAEIDGNRLEIDFEQAGRKRVLDSFVSLA